MLNGPPVFSYFLPPSSLPSLAPHSSSQKAMYLLNHMANTAMFKKPVIPTVSHAVLSLNYTAPKIQILWQERCNMDKGTDDMKINFRKSLKCV